MINNNSKGTSVTRVDKLASEVFQQGEKLINSPLKN